MAVKRALEAAVAGTLLVSDDPSDLDFLLTPEGKAVLKQVSKLPGLPARLCTETLLN